MEQNFQICLSTLNPRTKHDAAIGGDEGKLISYNFYANEESNTDHRLPLSSTCVQTFPQPYLPCLPITPDQINLTAGV